MSLTETNLKRLDSIFATALEDAPSISESELYDRMYYVWAHLNWMEQKPLALRKQDTESLDYRILSQKRALLLKLTEMKLDSLTAKRNIKK